MSDDLNDHIEVVARGLVENAARLERPSAPDGKIRAIVDETMAKEGDFYRAQARTSIRMFEAVLARGKDPTPHLGYTYQEASDAVEACGNTAGAWNWFWAWVMADGWDQDDAERIAAGPEAWS